MNALPSILTNITKPYLHILTNRFQPKRFPNSCDLFYEGQTPNMLYIFINGHIKVMKRKNKIFEYNNSIAIGFKEVVNSFPSQHSVRTMPQALISVIEKSVMLEILEDSSDELNTLLTSFYNSSKRL